MSPRRELLPGVRRRVWPSGTVTYEARWYDAGGRRHSEHYDTAAEVDAARQERLREHRRGGSGDPSGGRITLDAWWSRSSHRSSGGWSAGSSPATSCTGSRRRARRPEAHAPLTPAHRRRLVDRSRRRPLHRLQVGGTHQRRVHRAGLRPPVGAGPQRHQGCDRRAAGWRVGAPAGKGGRADGVVVPGRRSSARTLSVPGTRPPRAAVGRSGACCGPLARGTGGACSRCATGLDIRRHRRRGDRSGRGRAR